MRFLMLWFLLWDSKRPDPTRRIRRHFPVNRIYGVHLSIVCSNGSDWRMATGSGELFNYRSRLTGDNKESPNASRLQTTTVRTCSEKHIPRSPSHLLMQWNRYGQLSIVHCPLACCCFVQINSAT